MGESGVGKTCIMDRWTENVWRGEGACSSTFGVDFSQRVVQVNEQLMKARIWDASGKVSQRRFFSPFYRHSHGIILVYDITNKGTLEKLEDWLSSVVPLANSNATIMLVGCKADLESARQVSVEDARTFCAAHKVRLMAEVSCATGAGVDAAFQMLLSRIQHRLVEDSEAASTLSEVGNCVRKQSLVGDRLI
mmetsp:Transcript_2687/g.7269  ORF Transcript_2687/g.7269 Transcript_2687/m.7269 type:complete len:192 (+) Transcript_2687:577-1152(+)